MNGILSNLLKPENADRMALGFNQLRLDPDPNLAGIIQNRQALRQQQTGRDAAMKYFEGRPGAGGYIAALGAGGDGPATIQSYLSAQSAAAGRPPREDRNASIKLMQKECDEGDQDACKLALLMRAGGDVSQLLGIYYQQQQSGNAVQQTKDLGSGGLTKTTYKNGIVKYFQNGVELTDATAIETAIAAENEFDVKHAGAKAGSKKGGALLAVRIDNTQTAIQGVSNRISSTTPLLQRLFSHPGLRHAVGNLTASKRPANSFAEGHEGREFITLFDQLAGIIFLDAFQGLKGGGAITEAEGAKAAAAASNVSRVLSVEQFQAALQGYMDSLTSQQNRLVADLQKMKNQLDPTAALPTNLEVEF